MNETEIDEINNDLIYFPPLKYVLTINASGFQLFDYKDIENQSVSLKYKLFVTGGHYRYL